jgi:transcriptional regulator with XRE-family HTH domain
MTINQLKKIMKQKKLTYQDLADELGIKSKSAIAHWMKNKAIPSYWHKSLKERLVK